MRRSPQVSSRISARLPSGLGTLLLLLLSLVLVSAAGAVAAQTAGASSAAPDEEYQRDPNRQRELPAGATRLTLSGNIYFYQGGYFYKKEDDGYLRVEPPLGAELGFVPYGSTGFDIDGQRFFMSGTGTFYRFEPRRRSYIVTTPPYEWRRAINGTGLVDAYEDRLYGDPDLDLDDLRDRSGIPRAYPPGALDPDTLDGEAVPLFEAEGYRDRRQRSPRPYANVRPPYDANGERYDNRALLEAACRQDAFDVARRGSSLEEQQLRLYQRAYRDCIQDYEKRR